MWVNNLPKVATQWNSGTTRESSLAPRARIPSALTPRPLSHTKPLSHRSNALPVSPPTPHKTKHRKTRERLDVPASSYTSFLLLNSISNCNQISEKANVKYRSPSLNTDEWPAARDDGRELCFLSVISRYCLRDNTPVIDLVNLFTASCPHKRSHCQCTLYSKLDIRIAQKCLQEKCLKITYDTSLMNSHHLFYCTILKCMP